MSERAAGILGIGWHLPPKVRGNDFWGTGFRRVADEGAAGNILAVERDSQGKMVTLPPEIAEAMAVFGDDPFRGARVRRVIAGEAEPSDMEAAAAGEALRAAGIGPDEIDLVMVGSVPPDRLVAPSNAAAVQAKCGLSRATGWSVDVGCATFQAQLEAAVGLVRAGLYRRILLVVSSAVSRVIDYEHSISPMFGDAAAAVVIGDVPSGYGLIGRWSRTDGALREGVVLAPVADGVPHRRWDLVPGRIQVTTFDRVGAKRLGVRSTAYCREACLGALENAGLRIDDVALFVANQSVGWLVDACRRNLGLPREKVIDTFAEVANIGAAAIPYNLARAREEGRLRDGDVVLLYSPGAGFTWTANVIRWKEPGPGTVLDVRTNRS